MGQESLVPEPYWHQNAGHGALFTGQFVDGQERDRIDEDGSDMEGTGGRQDLFFFIHEDDMETMFDRFEKFGSDAPRWLEDIYCNEQGHWYPEWVEEWA